MFHFKGYIYFYTASESSGRRDLGITAMTDVGIVLNSNYKTKLFGPRYIKGKELIRPMVKLEDGLICSVRLIVDESNKVIKRGEKIEAYIITTVDDEVYLEIKHLIRKGAVFNMYSPSCKIGWVEIGDFYENIDVNMYNENELIDIIQLVRKNNKCKIERMIYDGISFGNIIIQVKYDNKFSICFTKDRNTNICEIILGIKTYDINDFFAILDINRIDKFNSIINMINNVIRKLDDNIINIEKALKRKNRRTIQKKLRIISNNKLKKFITSLKK
jgi:hypothetical protein